MERNVEWLNLHHLQCFWLVARRGGLAPAGAALHVTPSTVWAQVRKLVGKDLQDFQKERARIDELMRRAPVMTANK